MKIGFGKAFVFGTAFAGVIVVGGWLTLTELIARQTQALNPSLDAIRTNVDELSDRQASLEDSLSLLAEGVGAAGTTSEESDVSSVRIEEFSETLAIVLQDISQVKTNVSEIDQKVLTIANALSSDPSGDLAEDEAFTEVTVEELQQSLAQVATGEDTDLAAALETLLDYVEAGGQLTPELAQAIELLPEEPSAGED